MELQHHDFGEWIFEKYPISGITYACRVRLPSGYSAFTSGLDPHQEINTRLIATAPKLLNLADVFLKTYGSDSCLKNVRGKYFLEPGCMARLDNLLSHAQSITLQARGFQ